MNWIRVENSCNISRARRRLSQETAKYKIQSGGGVSRDALGISTLILITRYTMYWFIVIMPPYVYHVGYMPPPHPCLSTLFNPWDMIMLTRAEENSVLYLYRRRSNFWIPIVHYPEKPELRKFTSAIFHDNITSRLIFRGNFYKKNFHFWRTNLNFPEIVWPVSELRNNNNRIIRRP